MAAYWMVICPRQFIGHCDYAYGLVAGIIVSGAYCLIIIKSYIVLGRNPKFGVWIPLGIAEWCIPFWATLTLTLTPDIISRFFVWCISPLLQITFLKYVLC